MFSKQFGNYAYGVPRHGFYASKDTGFFSSSLPVLPHNNVTFTKSEQDGRYEFSISDKIGQDKDPLEDFERRAVGSLLPDDEDELLAGIMDDFYLNDLPVQPEDLEEYDIFGSGGGMELELDSLQIVGMPKVSIADGIMTNGTGQYTPSGGTGAVSEEHPYGEHPSRTLFVRNINSSMEDSELRSLFEEYGDIRTMYTACKHRGFVMISYYDIRAARTAMRALQNKPLGRRKLDIHFSFPKDNPSDKDANQGTLVVFNLDASVSNDELFQIFGDYGEVKEIRETPHKRHHKFIEFYDVRDAEAALKALNRCEIRGKRIKLEPSRPGGARQNLGIPQQLNQDLEQDEAWNFPHEVGLSATNSPPGNWAHFGIPIEPNLLHSLSKSPVLGSPNLMKSNNLPVLPPCISISPKPSVIRSDQGRINHVNHINTGFVTMPGSKILRGSLSNPFGSNGGDQVYNSRGNSFFSSHQLHHVGSTPTGVPPDRHFGTRRRR